MCLVALFSLPPCVGFSTFNDVTYPLVTQTVITNGKLWSFYVYQLNTTLLHGEHTSTNPRHNLCWGTPELKLFEAIEDGKVIGKCEKFPLFNFVSSHPHIHYLSALVVL
jgi:small subunit ribosomal protein S30